MSDSRHTEERLRNYLDCNQVMRERLCLAILPLLGPYTRERPRRPKGGPDGGRDIEAIYQGSIEVWGAVGFRNGGGNDDVARREISAKFHADLDRALSENPVLQGFVFFTNVDFTPSIIEQLKEASSARSISIVDIFDMERLRHALDSPEGLIARLQYLDIPMSATEQIALVSKFGNQLQNAVLARFDRVERTLSQMERFLEFQKPLFRLDIYVTLNGNYLSSQLSDEAIMLEIIGFQDVDKSTYCLCVNQVEHKTANAKLVMCTHLWLQDKDKVISFGSSLGPTLSTMASYCELSLTAGNHRIRIADLTTLRLNAHLTSGIQKLASRVLIDINGYEVFNCPISPAGVVTEISIPEAVPYDAKSKTWITGISGAVREIMTQPPNPSGRPFQLIRI